MPTICINEYADLDVDEKTNRNPVNPSSSPLVMKVNRILIKSKINPN